MANRYRALMPRTGGIADHMVPHRSRDAVIRELVTAMLDYLRSGGTDLAALSSNPSGTIAAAGEVVIVPIDPAHLSSDCSIAALYDPSSTPPRLLVSQDTSR